ncbi:bifunctional diguanylate cyclase/phosphodiesterase [Brucella grignonensis]|uniref:Diguanylate cyclase domain protein n=1 Tax=Brucella grignonensis TaxID=94627 RepID=A0A256EZ49_9HYPH|nr:EAL domain-containing protein [Brucella grignonensis]OYR07882.1 diguanylate cyclase domain protein [Brucella grignonensis]
MMTVFGCITYEHDLSLVIIAALVCGAGSWAAIRLFRRAVATTSTEKLAWLVLTALVAGAAIWCTHFIAMLGFQPGVPIGFDPILTIVSLLVAMAGAVCGFAIAASSITRLAPAIGGAVVGIAIAAMHYTGMMAYRVQGIVSWDISYLVVSVVLSVTLSTLALQFAARRNTSADRYADSYIATGILVLAIVSLHFTGMTAFRVEPLLVDGNFSNPEALRALALVVAGVAVPVVGAGLASHLIDNRARTEASEALSNMSNGLVMIAGNGTIRLFNDRVRSMLGLSQEQLYVGMSIDQYVRNIGFNERWNEAELQEAIAEIGAWQTQSSGSRIERHFNNGTILSISCQPIPDGGAILTYDDVTEARHGQKQITHMAFHDALTGLPNRRSFSEQIEILSKTGPFVMLMLDLDRFKTVNDTLGHAVGDQLLVEAARRLRNNCRPSDMLFRLGGDEMAMLGKLTQDHAEPLADRMIGAFARPFEVGAHKVTVGLSIGVATANRGDDPEFVQRMADLALYKAKGDGRGRAEIYRDGMIEEAAQRRRVESDLALAVHAGQFELYYQPLYTLPNRDLAGFEALLRWHHPERGMVSPTEFIPIAEQCGAIIDIGAWVIDEACRQAALWPDDLYVSINVSPVQLRSVDTLRQITEALAKYKLTPRRIEVEITETAMAENNEQIAVALAGLRALGVRIAMDDFGTGYSSLVHLREFELDRIKIDRSFISASDTDPNAAAVVRAITIMAKEMAISTTGEGVETEDQLTSLTECGCGTAQGYLLGRPTDARSASVLAGINPDLAA